MKMKLIAILLTAIFSLAACSSKTSKINGTYDYEVQKKDSGCSLLDLKTIEIQSDKIVIKGGGSKNLLRMMVETSRSFGNPGISIETEQNAEANVEKFSKGVEEKYKSVEVVEVNIPKAEWDPKALNPNTILFTKIYKFTMDDGKQKIIYADDGQRVGIEDFGKCIFRR